MKVIQVSPAFFGADGVVGGGERYPLELAKALAALTPTTLISFARQPRRFRDGELDVRLYRPWGYVRGKETNPFSLAWLPALLNADVVHVHQYRTAAANLGIGVGSLLGKRNYVTDEGGGGHHWGNRLRLGRRVDAHLAISQFAATTLPEVGKEKIVIYGGVDTGRYVPAETTVANRVVSVGRILPHKGFDVLLASRAPALERPRRGYRLPRRLLRPPPANCARTEPGCNVPHECQRRQCPQPLPECSRGSNALCV